MKLAYIWSQATGWQPDLNKHFRTPKSMDSKVWKDGVDFLISKPKSIFLHSNNSIGKWGNSYLMAKVVEADERRIKTFIEHVMKVLIKVVRETRDS